MPHIRLTFLVENTARDRRCLGEHGLAIWVQSPDGNVLFDTGQGRALEHNAPALGIDLAAAHALVLSHGHYDHTGGLPPVLDAAPAARLYAHPDVTRTRYSCSNARASSIGMPEHAALAWRRAQQRIVPVHAATPVLHGIRCTGPIPRRNDFEDTGGPFYLDPDATSPDPIDDDQAIYFDTPDGIVVVCGCAHAGVVNTVEHVRALTGRPIAAILGGLHLLQASPHRLELTHRYLHSLNLQLLAPCHCTGPRPTADLWHRFAPIVREAAVGARFEFQTR